MRSANGRSEGRDGCLRRVGTHLALLAVSLGALLARDVHFNVSARVATITNHPSPISVLHPSLKIQSVAHVPAVHELNPERELMVHPSYRRMLATSSPTPSPTPRPTSSPTPTATPTPTLPPDMANSLAPIFTPEVEYWKDKIIRWAAAYGLDPNLVGTIMQIESCGNPKVQSWAGAMGLFQVMPDNFQPGDDMLDPETNAARGLGILKDDLDLANGDSGMAMASYNAGPAIMSRAFAWWPYETQLYYQWGTGIYQDALAKAANSATLSDWLNGGGNLLCGWAHDQLFGMRAQATTGPSQPPQSAQSSNPSSAGQLAQQTNPQTSTSGTPAPANPIQVASPQTLPTDNKAAASPTPVRAPETRTQVYHRPRPSSRAIEK